MIYSTADQTLQMTTELTCVLKLIFLKNLASSEIQHTTIQSFHLRWKRLLLSLLAQNTNKLNSHLFPVKLGTTHLYKWKVLFNKSYLENHRR